MGKQNKTKRQMTGYNRRATNKQKTLGDLLISSLRNSVIIQLVLKSFSCTSSMLQYSGSAVEGHLGFDENILPLLLFVP